MFAAIGCVKHNTTGLRISPAYGPSHVSIGEKDIEELNVFGIADRLPNALEFWFLDAGRCGCLWDGPLTYGITPNGRLCPRTLRRAEQCPCQEHIDPPC